MIFQLNSPHTMKMKVGSGIVRVRLFALFEAQNAHKSKKWRKKCVWLSPKRNFLKKVMFWAQAKRESKTRIIYGPQEVHKSKRAASVLSLLPLGACYYENAPKYIISSLMPSRPYLISLLFTPHEAPLTPPISALCSALSVVSLSALSSV